jgi:hypothetical protein
MRGAASALLVIICSLSPLFAAKGGPLPYDLAVEVEYARAPGPEVLREELEWEIVKLLDEAACFRSVERYSEAQDRSQLVLTLSISDLVDEQLFDISLAQRDSPRSSPEVSKRMTARIRTDVELRISALPEAVPLRTRRFRKSLSYSPHTTEDPRYEVQLMLIDKLSREARAFVCDNKKLRREVERALAGKPLDD